MAKRWVRKHSSFHSLYLLSLHISPCTYPTLTICHFLNHDSGKTPINLSQRKPSLRAITRQTENMLMLTLILKIFPGKEVKASTCFSPGVHPKVLVQNSSSSGKKSLFWLCLIYPLIQDRPLVPLHRLETVL